MKNQNFCDDVSIEKSTTAEASSDRAKSNLDVFAKSLRLLRIIVNGKCTILVLTTVVASCSIVVSLLMPNIFESTVRIMSPQQSQPISAALMGQLSGLGFAGGRDLGLKNPNDTYTSILQSRTVADNIIRRFRLTDVYGKQSVEDTRRALNGSVQISSDKGGVISISVSDRDAQRAADIANAFVAELKGVTQSLAVTQATERRVFLEKQLHMAKDNLAAAEMELKRVQERTGLIEPNEQGRVIIESVARLKAQIAGKQVQLQAMRAFATEQNPDYARVQQELRGLSSELSKMEGRSGGGGDIQVPTGRIPEAGLEYARKYRDVTYYQALLEVLAKQYETARLDAERDATVIQVLDNAVPAERKSRPWRAFIVTSSTVLGMFFGVLVVLIAEIGRGVVSDPGCAAELSALKKSLSVSHLKRLRFIRK